MIIWAGAKTVMLGSKWNHTRPSSPPHPNQIKVFMTKKYGIAVEWIKGIKPQEETFWYETKSDREKAYRICRGDNKIAALHRVQEG